MNIENKAYGNTSRQKDHSANCGEFFSKAMIRKILLILLMCLCCLPTVVAQRSCRIFGRVSDSEGKPLALTTVRIQGKALLTAANLKGEYTLTIPRTDSATIVFAMLGYETRKFVLRDLRDSLRIDVTLPLYTANFTEAVVKSQRNQTSTIQNIKTENLHRAPSTTGNAVEELVTAQAGVSTHNELSSQYNVRGGSFDENVVYLNGIEIYRPLLIRSGQQEGLSVINSDMVESIRFSSGGFEARYGDKMSSVLDITYKRPERMEATINTSLLGTSGYVGWGNKQWSMMASARYKTTRYLLGSLDTEGEYHPHFFDYQFILSWHPNAKWTLDLMGNAADNHYDFIPRDRETRFGTMYDPRSFKVYFDGAERDAFRTLFGAATLTHHFTPSTFIALQTSIFGTREREAYDIQGQYWLNEVTTQKALGVGTYMEHARNTLNANVKKVGLRSGSKIGEHQLLAGIDQRWEAVNEHAREWEMRDSTGYSLPHTADALHLIYAMRSNNALTAHSTEMFLQDTWRRVSTVGLWNLTMGMRFTHRNWNRESFVSPRLSLGFIPAENEHWTFRAATGLYYQSPFYKELRDTSLINGVTTVSLNRNIRSQRSVHFVVGTDYTFRLMGRPFKLTAEAYYKHLSNLIPYSVDNVRVVYYGQNLAKGYAAGLDFKLFGEFVPGTDSWLTFSLMKTQEKLDKIWLPRPTDQRYNLSLYFTDYFPGSTRWALTLRAAMAGGLPFGPPHSSRSEQQFRAPAYKRVDVGLNYHLYKTELKDGRRPIVGWGRYLRNAWLGFDCFNLLGIKNVNSYYWITDIEGRRHAIPNYLTGRQLNIRCSVEF